MPKYILNPFENDFYKNYKSKDTEFWGLGIENETYLMFDKKIALTKEFIQNNHKKERYSINYYSNYKLDELIICAGGIKAIYIIGCLNNLNQILV